MDLAVTDPDCYGLIKFLRNLVVDLLNSSRNDSSLLVIISQTKHCKCFTSSCLTVSHNGAIVTSDDIWDNLSSCQIIDIILSGVLKNFVESESPIIKLIINNSFIFLINFDIEFLLN